MPGYAVTTCLHPEKIAYKVILKTGNVDFPLTGALVCTKCFAKPEYSSQAVLLSVDDVDIKISLNDEQREKFTAMEALL